MKEDQEPSSEKQIKLMLPGADARILYHLYHGVKVDTLLVSFAEKRRVLSTLDGYKQVALVGNTYTPPELGVRNDGELPQIQKRFPHSARHCPR